MVNLAVKKAILKDLDQLPAERQRQAQELVHGLLAARPAGTPGKELLRFSGVLDGESAREMLEAIEEGCERIDPDGW